MPKKAIKKKIIKGDRIFMGMPVRDATQSILVQPTAEDIAQGIKGDPEHCAFAQCVRRMLKSSTVFVYHTVAYVEVLGSKGERVLERYVIRAGAKEYLEDYDAKDKVKPAGFKLKAPEYSQTLDYKASLIRHYKRDGSYARWEAARKARNGKKATRKRIEAKRTIGPFRDGTGCVRFIGLAEGRLGKHEMGE